MAHSRNRIVSDLAALGLKRGDSVIVHSSYKAIGEVDGGPREVINALVETVLPGGALLMPNLNITQEYTVANPPRFDVKRDHIKHMVGILPELFKSEYAEHFSLHPTHSLMGIGEKAAGILADHEKAGVSCGAKTPWHKNALAGGKVLLIGVTQRCNTTYHCAEEQIPESYQLSKDIIDGVVIVDGREVLVSSRLHVWGNHPDFSIIDDELLAAGSLVKGRLGEAEAMLLDAGGFIELALKKLSSDARYFLTE